MEYTKIINLEIGKALYNHIHAIQGDNARYLLFNLLDNGVPFILTNRTVRAYAIKPDGTTIYDDLTIIDANNGQVELQLTSQILAVVGTLNVQLIIYEGTDKLSTTTFTIEVAESLIDEGAIESTNEYTSLTTALANADSAKQTYIAGASALETTYAPRLGVVETTSTDNSNKILDIPNQAYITEKARITDVNNALAIRDAQIASLSSGSPKGVYATLTDLQTAYPTGNSNIYVVTANGNWYYWNSSTWTNGGVYQSTGIADKTITQEKTSFLGKNRINLLDSSKFIDGSYISNGATVTENNYKHSGRINVKGLTSLVYYFLAPSNVVQGIRYIDFYNSNNQIVGSYVGTTGTPIRVQTIPVNSDYCIISVPKAHGNCMLVSGTSIDAGMTFMAYDNNVMTPDILVDEMSIKNIDVSKVLNLYRTGKNFIDTNKSVSGYVNSDGSISVSSSYKTTDYISVKAGRTYVISPKLRKFCLYTPRKSSIPNLFIDALTTNYVFTATMDGYVRFSYSTSDEGLMQLEEASVPSTYEKYYKEYNENINLNQYQLNLIQSLNNKLNGKTILNFGDSIANGDGNSNIGYAELIATKNNMTCIDYSVSGTTLTTGNAVASILAKVNAAITNITIPPDFILLEGGTNDILYVTNGTRTIGTIGTSFDELTFDTTTVIGALETIISKLKTAYPSSPIIFVSVHNMGSRNYSDQKNVVEAVQEGCRKWGIPIADIYHSGNMNTNIASMVDLYTYDSYSTGHGDKTHPNGLGYNKFYVPIIENSISKINS